MPILNHIQYCRIMKWNRSLALSLIFAWFLLSIMCFGIYYTTIESTRDKSSIYFKKNKPVIVPPPTFNNSTNISIDNGSILFIHIPKAAGTTFTIVLREIQCMRDPQRYSDCCRNPGSCYIKAYRRCISILGCVSHHPRRYVCNLYQLCQIFSKLYVVLFVFVFLQSFAQTSLSLCCHLQRTSSKVSLHRLLLYIYIYTVCMCICILAVAIITYDV